jgi:predicted NAD/FAD-dependent oxidoreductase
MYNIAIIGGGPASNAAATLLAPAGRQGSEEMGTGRTTRATTLRVLLSAGLLLLGAGSCFAADELHLIISPNSTTLTEKGFVDFDAYIYNPNNRPMICSNSVVMYRPQK